ncbi:ABC transporter ATP-binding protein [soil metagenome]
MPDAAVIADRLGKQYALTPRREKHRTLRDSLGEGLRSSSAAAGSLFAGRPRRRQPQRLFWALRDVSFEVARGEVLGIIGGNGAGKSTLLKILSRITEPTAGAADIYGRVGSLLEVGTGFHQELSGAENIFLNGAILGMNREEIRRKFDEIVSFAEVETFLDTPVKHYSSGMYLRLAFAVAAHLDPEILLVDEVLAVGDASFQKRCLGKMNEVARAGRTVLFVSHNLAAIQTLCNRVLWLRGGSIVEEGPSSGVISHYLRSVHQTVRDQCWPDPAAAPGNEKVRLRRARIYCEDGTPPDAITTRTPFRLEFQYWNLQPGAYLNLSLHVYNEQGVLVFTAVPVNEPLWQGRPYPTGLFRDVCAIPGDLLNDGAYRVELLVVQDDATVVYQHDDILGFEVQDSVEMRGAWFGEWGWGMVPAGSRLARSTGWPGRAAARDNCVLGCPRRRVHCGCTT